MNTIVCDNDTDNSAFEDVITATQIYWAEENWYSVHLGYG
jgi:hypothetical protein